MTHGPKLLEGGGWVQSHGDGHWWLVQLVIQLVKLWFTTGPQHQRFTTGLNHWLLSTQLDIQLGSLVVFLGTLLVRARGFPPSAAPRF